METGAFGSCDRQVNLPKFDLSWRAPRIQGALTIVTGRREHQSDFQHLDMGSTPCTLS
jgi:hypothetical protein